MKTIKIFSLTILALVMTSQVFAQTSKIAYTNVDAILGRLYEADTVEGQLKKYEDLLVKELRSMEQQYKVKITEYQEGQSSLPQLVLKTKQEEIVQLEKNIREYQQSAELDLRKKRDQLLSPVFQKIMASIDKVSKSLGYDFVLSSDAGGFPIVLYSANESDNITEAVIKDLKGKPQVEQK